MTRVQKLAMVGLFVSVVVVGGVCYHAAYAALALGAIVKDLPQMNAVLRSSGQESVPETRKESVRETRKDGVYVVCLHLAGYLGLVLAGLLAFFSRPM